MNLFKKDVAGFSSITLRGGRITKWNGQAASHAPHLGDNAASVCASSSAIAISIALASATAIIPSAAIAGSCSQTAPGSGEWVCSGAENSAADTRQLITQLNGLPIVIRTTPDFGLNVPENPTQNRNYALFVTGNAGLIIQDEHESSITATFRGIQARNILANGSVSGGVVLELSGSVSGRDRDGIFAQNYGTSMSISSNNAWGGDDGIDAQQFGNGSLTISSIGTATGGTDSGIWAFTRPQAANVTISSNNAVGYLRGIYLSHSGTGSARLTTTGTTTGTSQDGIWARNSADSTSLSITTGGLTTGGEDGIDARNYGTAGLAITANADVTGGTGIGIRAFNSANDTTASMVINQAAGTTTTGAIHGIDANNAGGSLTINALGTSIGATGSGVRAFNQATATDLTITSFEARGAIRGIEALSFGAGALSVTSTGMANATAGDGIYARNSAAGTSLSITTEGTTTGGEDGIEARSYGTSGLSITVNADVTGQSGMGIRAFSRTNENTASMAINQAAGTTTTGAVNGITAYNYAGSLTINALGTSTGNSLYRGRSHYGRGIFARNGRQSRTYNTTDLTIVSHDAQGINGIEAINFGTGALSVTSTGSATGSSLATPARGHFGFGGIVARQYYGTTLDVTSNNATGGRYGIFASNRGTGALTITSTGTATGLAPASGSASGIHARQYYNGTNLIVNSNNAIGGFFGISAENRGTGALAVTSTGTATGTTSLFNSMGDGISARQWANGTSLDVTSNNATGAINGIHVSNAGTGALRVTSTGTATGAASEGIRAFNSGTDLTVVANNTSGGRRGIFVLNQGSGEVNVTTTGSTTGANEDGISAANRHAGASLEITTGGAVTGGRNGINALNYGRAGLTITANADVTGGTGMGILAFNSANDTTASMVINQAAGTTTGGVHGIYANNNTGSLTINALGTSIGNTGSGIYARNNLGSGPNFGTDLTIVSSNATGGRHGIYTINGGSGALTVTSTGSTTGANEDGISAANRPAGASLEITTGGAVTGGRNGINALNYGRAGLTITANADVTGGTGMGIRAFNSANDTTASMVINQAAGTTTTGGVHGIYANNNTGSLTINALGTSIGNTGSGIYARNNLGSGANFSTDLEVTSNNATGMFQGVRAVNFGQGSITVTSTGTATGLGDGSRWDVHGIYALMGSYGTSVVVASNNASGSRNGIRARSLGSGSMTVTSTGTAIATGIPYAREAGTAIYAMIHNGTDLEVSSNNASGSRNGILAINNGSGSLTITSTGSASGTSLYGILAGLVSSGTSSLDVTANNASGGTYGIYTANFGTGPSTITVTGAIEGGTGAGIYTRTNAGSPLNASGSLTTINVASTATVEATSGIAIRNSEGDSVVNVADGAVINGAIQLGDGSDIANLSGANVLAGITLLDGGDDASTADGMIDVLNLNGVTAMVNAGAVVNWEVVNVNAGVVRIDELVTGTVGICGGSLTLGGASQANTVLGCVSDDTIVLTDDTAISGAVEGAGGSDMIAVLGNASVLGSVYGGGDGQDASASADTGDMIFVNTTGTVGGVNGQLGDDVIVLTAGTVSGSITGGAGADEIGLNGGTVGGDIDVEADNDLIVLDGSAVTGSIMGGVGDDVIGLNGGTAGAVDGGSGSDLIVLTGANIAGAVAGGSGNDLIGLNSGSTGGGVQGDDGDDTINWNSAAATAPSIDGGLGSDMVNINDAGIVLSSVTLDGGDDVSSADGMIDTLNLNAGWSGNLTGASTTNWEVLNINGGTVRFSDAAISAGVINVNGGGTLDGSNNLAAVSNVNVGAGSRLMAGSAAGTNAARIIGNLTNAGAVSLAGPPGQQAAGDRLTVTGNYAGTAGSSLVFDTVLGGSNATDQLLVGGNLTGMSSVTVNNVGGTGSLTTGDGIKLVDVAGTSSGMLLLNSPDNRIDVGAFRYTLNLGGVTNPSDQDWYLRSQARDIVTAGQTLGRLGQDLGLAALGTLHERVGNQEQLRRQMGGQATEVIAGMWGRLLGSDYSANMTSASYGDTFTNGQFGGMQLGFDFVRWGHEDGSRTLLGAYGGYLWSGTSDWQRSGATRLPVGNTRSDGAFAGAYLTHYGASDWYVDLVVQHNWLDHHANGNDGTSLDTDGRTWLISGEVGKAFDLGKGFSIEPQVQLIYGNSRLDNALDSTGVANSWTMGDSLTGRTGLRLKHIRDYDEAGEGGLFTAYLKANVWGRLSGDDASLAVGASTPGSFRSRDLWGDVGFGTTFSVSRNAELFFDGDVEFSLDKPRGGTALSGRTGFRMQF